MTLRQYIPQAGAIVKMRQFSDYTSRNIHVWSHLRVKSIDTQTQTVEFEVLNGLEPTGRIDNCPLSAIDPPIGWQPRYTIYCKPDKVETVLSWFARGIVVRQSHDMSGGMPTAFQPMDNAGPPHWQFPEITDAIPAELCPSVFRIVKVETEEINEKVYKAFDPECPHCLGTGRRSLANLAAIRGESIDSLKANVDSLRLQDYSYASETFECHCHWGSFRKLGRSKRAKLIKEWERDGWSVNYYPYAGGFWERTRETVIHDWTDPE